MRLRHKLFEPVPRNFLVDDFFINMKVLEKNYWSINNLKAIVYDNSTDDIQAEFKRKIRISTGNFQNLTHAFFTFIMLKTFIIIFLFFFA